MPQTDNAYTNICTLCEVEKESIQDLIREIPIV
jgi:hypothetical protein